MGVPFLNPNSLACIDEMFYRLPFPDSVQLEKLQEEWKVTADAVNFLREMQEELEHPRAMDDLRKGWIKFLEEETGSRGPPNPARLSESSRRERNRTPTEEELEELVCLLSFLNQHCEVHMMMFCSLQGAEAALPATNSQVDSEAEARSDETTPPL